MTFKFLIFAVFISFFSFTAFGQDETPDFRQVVKNRFSKAVAHSPDGAKKNIDFQRICPTETNFAAQRVFEEYGAIFIAGTGVVVPPSCIFENDESVYNFQNSANPQTEKIGGYSVTLQKPAMEALLEARKEAAQKGLAITPRGSVASKRSFSQTLTLWNSRFFPALNYHTRRGKISRGAAENARAMPISRQVEQVLRWEEEGLYFSKDFRKSILYSVAAPGASQHIFLLALDVQQFSNPRVREILAKHGWYQTVKSDAPHFTYLGVEEEKLPSLGLKEVWSGGQKFWIPNIE